MEFKKSTGGGGKWFSGKAKLSESNGIWTARFAPQEQGGEAKSFSFADSLLPEFPKAVPLSVTDKYFVGIVLESDGDNGATDKVEKVLSIRPLMWVDELMKIVDVTREGNSMGQNPTGTPQYYTKKTNWNGVEGEKSQVNWMFEFVDGDFKGVQVPYNVHYRFECSESGKACYDFEPYQLDYSNSTRIRQVVFFYEKQLDILQLPIEWPEDGNIIPTLFARILDKDQYFSVSGNKGYIEDLEAVEKPTPPAPVVEEAPLPDESLEDPAQLEQQDADLEDW